MVQIRRLLVDCTSYDRQQNWGVVARLERECDLARVLAELAELDACKAAVERHRSEL